MKSEVVITLYNKSAVIKVVKIIFVDTMFIFFKITFWGNQYRYYINFTTDNNRQQSAKNTVRVITSTKPPVV